MGRVASTSTTRQGKALCVWLNKPCLCSLSSPLSHQLVVCLAGLMPSQRWIFP